jgi:hypothetical protein
MEGFRNNARFTSCRYWSLFLSIFQLQGGRNELIQYIFLAAMTDYFLLIVSIGLSNLGNHCHLRIEFSTQLCIVDNKSQ